MAVRVGVVVGVMLTVIVGVTVGVSSGAETRLGPSTEDGFPGMGEPGRRAAARSAWYAKTTTRVSVAGATQSKDRLVTLIVISPLVHRPLRCAGPNSLTTLLAVVRRLTLLFSPIRAEFKPARSRRLACAS